MKSLPFNRHGTWTVLLTFFAGLPGFTLAGPGDPVDTWKNDNSLNEIIFSAPAIGPTGSIIFGTKNEDVYNPSGNVYAYHPNHPYGIIKWKFPATSGPDWFESPPAIARDGTVYIGCWNNTLYAINGQTGNEIWHFIDEESAVLQGAMTAAPAIGRDGSIYIGSTNGKMYAVSAQGNKLWNPYETDPELLSPILAGAVFDHAGDTLYFGDGDGTFHAVNRINGEELWTYSVPPEHDLIVVIDGIPTGQGEREITSSAALDSQGNIFFTCENGYLYMLSPEGIPLDAFASSGSILSSPIVDANDRVYFCSRDTYLYCVALDNTGVLDLVWDREVGDVLYSSPTLDDIGNLIVAAYSGDAVNGEETTIMGIGQDGTNSWTPSSIATINDASPAIAPDGSLYIGGYDGRMYKFEGAAALSMSGWPHQGASRRQTGFSEDITKIDLIDLFPGIQYDLQGLSNVPWYGIGWIRDDNLPEIYHMEHGRVHIAESNASGIVSFDRTMNKWLYAYNSWPNYFFDASSQKWVYHAQGTSVDYVRWFYDFSIPGWVMESDL